MRAVILDGWLGNGRRFEGLRRRLEGAGMRASIWLYNNTGRRELGEVAEALAVELGEGEVPVHVVGYSMGGLVVREALRQRPELPVASATFIHVPHGGTQLARVLPLPGVKQLQPGHPFLERLKGQRWPWRTLNIWCPGDLMVVPGWRSRWEGAGRNAVCRVPAHVWPIYSAYWHQEICRFICRTDLGGEGSEPEMGIEPTTY